LDVVEEVVLQRFRHRALQRPPDQRRCRSLPPPRQGPVDDDMEKAPLQVEIVRRTEDRLQPGRLLAEARRVVPQKVKPVAVGLSLVQRVADRSGLSCRLAIT
jgi:hypothetical protein